jgi:predicted RNase H-like HicB family nuclease
MQTLRATFQNRQIVTNYASIGNMTFRIETEREVDGRWIAEIPILPGVMAYGETKPEAVAKAEALALRVLADRIEQEKRPADEPTVSFTCP